MIPFNDHHLLKFLISAVLFVVVESFGLLHIILPEQLALAASVLLKVYPMTQLNRFVHKKLSRSDNYITWVWLGLSCSACGDAFLVYSQKYPVTFLLGLFMFLIAHVYYLRAFGYGDFHPKIFIVCFLQGLLMLVYLFNGKLGEDSSLMKVSCVAYGIALFAMMWRACSRVKKISLHEGNWQIVMAAIGSMLFVISDVILAVEKFRFHIPATRLWNMSTYFAGQFLIATSTHNRQQIPG